MLFVPSSLYHKLIGTGVEPISLTTKEIYLNVSIDMIEARGNRDIYRQYKDGETKNVVGCDIKFETPERPDFIIENRNSISDLINRTNTIAEIILSEND